MFSICKQTHPATAVEHALTCHFFNRAERSLVVAGANIIRVFRLIPDVDPLKKEVFTEARPPKMKLECLATYPLFGNVMSMQAVALAGSARDSLLLSFRDAKLSVVEYDADLHDLRTLSLHFFEEEEMRGGWTQHHHIPMVRVDPEDRCAVMLVYGRKLVVLPFRRESALDETDGALGDVKPNIGAVKPPVLSSYMIILKELEEKMDNVIDIQFLYGYYEPTLLILYEPVKTFPGRIAVRQDTCAMVAISLNIQQRVHPIIWSVSNLPFDCTQAIPVKKPIGGTLILSINAFIYLNQSVPPYGVAVNSIADSSTNFPLKTQEGVKMSLEGAQLAFISFDRLVISLKGGELYVITLYADSMRSVRSFHFEKAAASVLTTCMCLCQDNYLFLGSRLGNSLLLRFTEKEQSTLFTLEEKTYAPRPEVAVAAAEVDDPPAAAAVAVAADESKPDESDVPSKKKRLDTLGDWMASDVADIRDLDELEVYGSEAKTSVQIASYVFEVCDSLLNIGPCGNISMGEPAFLSEEFSNEQDPDIELFTTSGYGKNGALCVLQRSIRPQVVTTFELPGCVDMWTVIGAKSEVVDLTEGAKEEELNHAFMILSQDDSTMILQTGLEINEVDKSGFSTQGPTVYAGNIGYNKYIIQVSKMGVRLLEGLTQVQHIPLDLGYPIVHASAADPHVVLLTEDGQVVVLTLKELRGQGRLSVTKPQLSLAPQIHSLCAYRDVSGMFSNTTSDFEVEVPNVYVKPEPMETFFGKKEVDDEDDLLYGEAEMPVFSAPKAPEPVSSAATINIGAPWWNKYLQEVKTTYWLLLTRENGNLEIYSLPEMKLSYLVRNFGQGLRVLVDTLGATPTLVTNAHAETEPPPADALVREILMVSLGHHGSRPLLLARLDDELLIYQVFWYPRGAIKIRFRRLQNNNILVRERRARQREKQQTVESRVCQLRYFSNIAGYNGVFVCGPFPHWVFLTSRGELRTHPMSIDGSVTCFAPFQNVNCPQGFLYFNRKEELRICVLPTHLSYDAPWPVRKVPLRCTPHFATYHLESKTYCVVTSLAEPTDQYYKFNGEDKELSVEERGERFPFPPQERFSMLLFSPVSWEVIPNTKTELEDWEHVTCLKNVSLAYEGTRSGLKGYIAVGTNYNYGEDVTSRGRILIYDIIEVVPEPGQPLTKNRFKTIYAKEQKGPVTAITHCLGFLVSAVGQKIYIWQLKDNDLVGVAFIDTNIYIHQLLSIKSLILVADVYKSISLLRFQEEYRTLSLVSRDFRPSEVYTCEFLLDNSQMGFLVADKEKNLILYMYQPESRESYGGQRLLRKADFHLSQHVNTFFRIRCKMNESTLNQKHLMGADKRHVTMFATLDGGLGYLLPVPEKTYRRLLMLQNVLVNHIPHLCGLNPKAFRTCKNAAKLLSNPARGIIDGELVWSFLGLPTSEKLEIAKKIGTKVDEIIDDVTDIERLTAHY